MHNSQNRHQWGQCSMEVSTCSKHGYLTSLLMSANALYVTCAAAIADESTLLLQTLSWTT